MSWHAYDTGWRCSCGWTGTSDEYDTHLADELLASPVVAQMIAAAKAEALREAADDLPDLDAIRTVSLVRWLHARAHREAQCSPSA